MRALSMSSSDRSRRWAVAAVAALCGCGRVAFDDVAPGAGCPTSSPLVTEPASKYVAPVGGSNANPGTLDSPWATIAYALANAPAGEHIVLLDGQYAERLIVAVSNRTIRAKNDGMAIFDGGGTAIPCDIGGSGLTIEGVHCRNGSGVVVNVASQNTVLRRVTADTSPSAMVFRVQNSLDVTLEDVAAWGPATNSFIVVNSTRTTIRRCYARWDGSPDMYSSALVLADGTSDSRIENCVIRATVPYDAVRSVVGINLFSPGARVDRNTIAGTVVSDIPNWAAVVSTGSSRIEGNRFIDTVLMTSGGGLYQRSDADFGVDRLTSVELVGAGAFVLQAHSYEPKDTDFAIGGYVRNSVLALAPEGFYVFDNYVTGFEHAANTLFGLAMPYRGTVAADPSEELFDPAYDKERYGFGAYLIRNDHGTGAEVLYRTENGVLTETPLWPWPLEERILRDAGSSVTYESGGGLWRTLPDELTPDCP